MIRKAVPVLLAFGAPLLATSLLAAPPQKGAGEQHGSTVGPSTSAGELLGRARVVLEPEEQALREVEIVTRDPQGKEKVWHGHEARRVLDGKSAMLLLLDAPESVRGFAVLAIGGRDDTHEMWVYTPPVGRVRKLEYVGMAQPFLGTDFTFADLGLVDLGRGEVRYAGHDVIEGKALDIVETVPSDQHAYKRILTYVTPDGLPVRTEYRDVADRPWRVLTYTVTTDGRGKPRLRALEVKDLQTGYESELRFGDARDGELPKDLFDPLALARVAQNQSLQAIATSQKAAKQQPVEVGR